MFYFYLTYMIVKCSIYVNILLLLLHISFVKVHSKLTFVLHLLSARIKYITYADYISQLYREPIYLMVEV